MRHASTFDAAIHAIITHWPPARSHYAVRRTSPLLPHVTAQCRRTVALRLRYADVIYYLRIR